MVVPVGPNQTNPSHVARVRDEWGGGGGGSTSDVRVVDPLPVPVVLSGGIVPVNIVNYLMPLEIRISDSIAVLDVRADTPTQLGRFDLRAASNDWTRYVMIKNRWRGGSPTEHGVFAIIRHQNTTGGNIEIRLRIEYPSSFSRESKIVVPTSPNDQFFVFQAPTGFINAPSAWQEQLLPIFWQTAYLEVKVPSGYSSGDLWLLFSHAVEIV